jgi:hypothetical protein
MTNFFLILVICFSTSAFAESPKGYVEVTATGSAETRDSALIDACRLAVGKVHGTRILGVMANRNSEGVKIDAAGHSAGKDAGLSIFGRTTDVADNTSMTFGGLLLKYEVLKEDKDSGPTGRWKIQIKAEVLNTIPDRFAGRQAVAFLSAQQISEKLKSSDLDPSSIDELSRRLYDSVRDIFSNHPQFVILEREDEEALNAELSRVRGGNSAVLEQSKLQGEKVADFFVQVVPSPVKVEVKTFNFENTPSLQKVKINLTGIIKVTDLTTKGEICSTRFEAANPKSVSSAGDLKNATSKAIGELSGSFDKSMREAKRNIITGLGLANIVYTNNNYFTFAGGFDSSLMSDGDRIVLWKEDNGKKIKIFEGDISLISSGFNFKNITSTSSFKSGDAFTFTVDQTRKSAVPSETSSEPAEKKPSLKDRLDFNL